MKGMTWGLVCWVHDYQSYHLVQCIDVTAQKSEGLERPSYLNKLSMAVSEQART